MDVLDRALCRAGQLRLRVAEAACRAWNEAGFDYAVVHGLEGYPAKVGRDVDVLIREKDRDGCVACTVSCLEEMGFVVTVHQRPWAVWIVGLCFTEDVPVGVEIDLLWEMQWAWTRLLQPDRVFAETHSLGACRISAVGAFMKGVVLLLLGGDVDRAVERCKRDVAVEHQDACQAMLRNMLGAEAAAVLWDVAMGGRSPDRMALYATILWHGLWRQAPMDTVRLAWNWLRNEMSGVLPASALPVVALVGPDGAGKSTLIRHLQHCLPRLLGCAGVVVRHWRPDVLPPLARWRGSSGPTAEGPRRQGGRFGWLRSLYYALDYLLGHVLRDRVACGRMQLVLYDRHAADMLVDPVRYGIRTPLWPRRTHKLIPRPGVVIALLAKPAVIAARKQELSQNEIMRQNDAWRALHADGIVDHLVSTDCSEEESLARLVCLIAAAQVSA